MANFLCLFWNRQDFKPSPEQMERLTKAWMTWIDHLKSGGHLARVGDRLDSTGKVVRGKTKSVTDGPYAEAKDIILGFLVLQAKDMAEAAELAKGCPNLEVDGMVEVRPIIST